MSQNPTRLLLAAALIAMASGPAALAAGSTGSTGFAAFRGFPNFAQNSRFIPFTASNQMTRFPLGLCCVTAAQPPEARVIAVAENPPVPDRKPAPRDQVSIESVAGVTIMRGSATPLPRR